MLLVTVDRVWCAAARAARIGGLLMTWRTQSGRRAFCKAAALLPLAFRSMVAESGRGGPLRPLSAACILVWRRSAFTMCRRAIQRSCLAF